MTKPAGFYIPRSRMPQVDPKDYPELVYQLYDLCIGVSFEVVPAKMLHAHQEVNHARAQSIPVEVARIPVLVSREGYVLDGNHRWWHCRALAVTGKGDGLLNIVRIDMSFDDAVKFLLAQLYVTEVKKHKPHATDDAHVL